MKGPVLVMMAVSLASSPVLNFAGVKKEWLFGLRLHLSHVGWTEAEASGARLCIFWECFLKTQFPLILAPVLKGVNKKEIGSAGCKNPSAISRDIKSDDCLAQRGNMGFGIDP